MTSANMMIRERAKESGVYFWEIAERLGIQDSAFSKKMRRELPDEEREKVLAIIHELSQEKQKEG